MEITAQAVEAYDPTKRAGRHLGARWRTVFDARRAAFLAHKSVRLRELDRLFHRASRISNLALAAALLEQTAREMGGAYTNRREITGGHSKAPSAPTSPVAIFSAVDAILPSREAGGAVH